MKFILSKNFYILLFHIFKFVLLQIFCIIFVLNYVFCTTVDTGILEVEGTDQEHSIFELQTKIS
jgi:hypothetical protein